MPHVRVKRGVVLEPLTPALIRLLAAVDQAVRIFGRDFTVTCGREGHRPSNPHTRGQAIDIRTSDLADGVILALWRFLRETLGKDWTVLYEVKARPANGVLAPIAYINPEASAAHIHIQPRKGTTWPPEDMPPVVNV